MVFEIGRRWRWERRWDTLFGRMAIFTTLVLFAVQAGWFAVLTIQRPHHDLDGYSRELLLVVEAAHNDIQRGTGVSPMLHAREVAPTKMPPDIRWEIPLSGPSERLVGAVRAYLPPGTSVIVGKQPSGKRESLWVRYPSEATWIVTDLHPPPPPPPILLEAAAMLLAAMLLSLGAAWQMQRPLSRVSAVARRFGAGERPAPVEENGPREVRELMHSVNQMMQRISESEDERSLMLAGIAHDLKAPLTRMKLRASVLENEADRGHFGRDVDSLTHIVQQFLEFAGSEPSDGPDVFVDEFLAEQFSAPDDGDESLFVHRLHAGPDFLLPRTLIDRLTTNLVDNAFEHGEPPVEIATYRTGALWVIEIRDHGLGIPESRIEEASKPFARLDPARAGDGHCGLGLAIVGRLARKRRGRCVVQNAFGGGLSVRIEIPVEKMERTVVAAALTNG